MIGDERSAEDGRHPTNDGVRPRLRLVIVALVAVSALAVTVPLVRWWRDRPVAVNAVVEVDGRACFGQDTQIWVTAGTVRPPSQPGFDFAASFEQTGPYEGVLSASGTSVLTRTSPTTHDPRLAVGCAIP